MLASGNRLFQKKMAAGVKIAQNRWKYIEMNGRHLLDFHVKYREIYFRINGNLFTD